MRWTWNDRKGRENERKHGLAFETASLVFDDPYAATREDCAFARTALANHRHG